jgi:NADH pyrophosphatase NudC (nudix superfamily)
MTEVWKPSVTVAAVIERNGAFLLVEEEAHGRIVFNQPAGHWERGETLAEACARETLEETAHHFRPTELLGVYRWHFPEVDVTFLRFAFCGEITGHEPARALDKEIRRAVWLTADEIRGLRKRHRSPLVLACVEDYLAGRRYPLDVVRHHA